MDESKDLSSGCNWQLASSIKFIILAVKLL